MKRPQEEDDQFQERSLQCHDWAKYFTYDFDGEYGFDPIPLPPRWAMDQQEDEEELETFFSLPKEDKDITQSSFQELISGEDLAPISSTPVQWTLRQDHDEQHSHRLFQMLQREHELCTRSSRIILHPLGKKILHRLDGLEFLWLMRALGRMIFHDACESFDTWQ